MVRLECHHLKSDPMIEPRATLKLRRFISELPGRGNEVPSFLSKHRMAPYRGPSTGRPDWDPLLLAGQGCRRRPHEFKAMTVGADNFVVIIPHDPCQRAGKPPARAGRIKLADLDQFAYRDSNG